MTHFLTAGGPAGPVLAPWASSRCFLTEISVRITEGEYSTHTFAKDRDQ